MASFIIYEGPSLYDGKPIVVIFQDSSGNKKTGNMCQTWILRADIDPISASRIGEDKSICGDCPHMGIPNHDKEKGWADNRSCYVNLLFAPNGVFKAYRRGAYEAVQGHAGIASLGRGKVVRIGSYGDPAAVPGYVWDSLLSESKAHTAYTHGKENPDPARIMTSADSLNQARQAWTRGERTFRVIRDISERDVSEILCPASKEAGFKSTCAKCKLCGGASIRGKSVAIVDHGPQRKRA